MKKHFIVAAFLSTVLMMSSCGIGGGTNTLSGNYTPNNSLLGGALSGQAGSSANLLGNVLSSLLNLPTTQESLVGTWVYRQPKVIFESDNILAKLGSSVASSKIESTMANYLTKIGMTAGHSSYTFNNDNTVVFQVGGRTTQGTYSYDPNTKQLTLTGAFGLASLQCYAIVQANGELDLVFDASKLLSLGSKVSTSTTTGKTLSSILSNYNGLKLGWSMTK